MRNDQAIEMLEHNDRLLYENEVMEYVGIKKLVNGEKMKAPDTDECYVQFVTSSSYLIHKYETKDSEGQLLPVDLWKMRILIINIWEYHLGLARFN